MKWHRSLLIGLVCTGGLLSSLQGQNSTAIFEKEAACHTLEPASAGGPLPKNPNILVLRYFSYGNYEVAYRGKVLLFDAFFDNSRSPIAVPVGLKESDIKRADAIFIGHTHLDHYEDAPAIAKRTGASVFLAPPGLRYVQSQGLPAEQTKIVRGGESIHLSGYTVQTALGIHMQSYPKTWAALQDVVAQTSTATGEQKKKLDAWKLDLTGRISASEDPLDPEKDTMYHGTIVYVVTFDDGFRLVYSDTAGVLSGGERVLADSIHAKGGKIDVAILGYLDGSFAVSRAIKTALDRVNTWQPSIFLPSHFHDGDLLYAWPMPEMPTAPLFEALREKAPETRGIEPLFRSPICVDTKTDEFFVGNYVR